VGVGSSRIPHRYLWGADGAEQPGGGGDTVGVEVHFCEAGNELWRRDEQGRYKQPTIHECNGDTRRSALDGGVFRSVEFDEIQRQQRCSERVRPERNKEFSLSLSLSSLTLLGFVSHGGFNYHKSLSRASSALPSMRISDVELYELVQNLI
jgi:hypothetical protein